MNWIVFTAVLIAPFLTILTLVAALWLVGSPKRVIVTAIVCLVAVAAYTGLVL